MKIKDTILKLIVVTYTACMLFSVAFGGIWLYKYWAGNSKKCNIEVTVGKFGMFGNYVYAANWIQNNGPFDKVLIEQIGDVEEGLPVDFSRCKYDTLEINGNAYIDSVKVILDTINQDSIEAQRYEVDLSDSTDKINMIMGDSKIFMAIDSIPIEVK